MTTPSVGIIICTWNRCNLLTETLESLRCQNLPDDCEVEVIIVDNNSTDHTAVTVHEFMAKWPFGKLHYLYEGKQGKQFALNLAVRSALGNILAFTDDDVVVPNDWVVSILRVFADPQVEVAGGKTLLLWPKGSTPAWFQSRMLAVVAGVDLGDERLCPPPVDYTPAGTNLIVRRSVFDRIGPFSEAHYRHMDYEFGVRASRNGIVMEYNPLLVVRTSVPQEVLNKRYFRRWYFKLGIAAAMQARPSSPILLGVPRWIWRQLLTDSMVVAFHALRGRFDRVFERDVRIAQLLGYISSAWHYKLWPSAHQQWVERWSQKRGPNFG